MQSCATDWQTCSFANFLQWLHLNTIAKKLSVKLAKNGRENIWSVKVGCTVMKGESVSRCCEFKSLNIINYQFLAKLSWCLNRLKFIKSGWNNPFKNYWAIASIKFLAIVGFEPRISGVGSNCYTNCATTQPKLNNICFLTILDNLAFTASFDPWVFMPLDQTQSPLECPNILLPSREISLTRATIEKKYIDFFG